jgi:uncharacterized spore protein YtfJ
MAEERKPNGANGLYSTANLKAMFDRVHEFISTKTVVGEPMTVGDVTIIPLVDVSFGVGARQTSGGMGAKITPNALIVITDGAVQLVNVKSQDSVNKLIDMVPGILQKFNIDGLFKRKETAEAENEAE